MPRSLQLKYRASTCDRSNPEVTPPAEPQQTPEQRIQKLKDDGVFIKKRLKSKVVDVKQRFFSARKHLPKSVFEAKEKKRPWLPRI